MGLQLSYRLRQSRFVRDIIVDPIDLRPLSLERRKLGHIIHALAVIGSQAQQRFKVHVGQDAVGHGIENLLIVGHAVEGQGLFGDGNKDVYKRQENWLP